MLGIRDDSDLWGEDLGQTPNGNPQEVGSSTPDMELVSGVRKKLGPGEFTRGNEKDRTPARTFGAETAPYDGFAEASRAVFSTLAETEPKTPSELLMRLLATLMATEARAEEAGLRAAQAESESLVDPLTGLANRRAWERAIDIEEDRCSRFGTPASVAIIDLDDLKVVNDTFGHQAGDNLLRRVAKVIKIETRAHDFIARLGGDEFAVLAVNCNEHDAELLGLRLSLALAAEGVQASLGVSSRINPEHHLKDVWDQADSTMYRSKQGKKLVSDQDADPAR